jgi:ATP-dependent protease ClpP protease subunit
MHQFYNRASSGRFDIKDEAGIYNIYLDGMIGAYEGIQSADFVREVHNLRANQPIALHINSEGGNVFQAVDIFNALKRHSGRITAYINGLAASAASYIAMAADEIIMGMGSQIMIHDAAGPFFGNSEQLDQFKKDLERVSDSIASFYSYRAGGTVAEWRKRMKAETWYNAEEAVRAGLADKAEGTALNVQDIALRNLSLSNCGFKYLGREEAPDPFVSSESQMVDNFNDTASTAESVDLISLFKSALKEAS